MTPYKNFSQFPRLKNAALKGAFFISLSGLIVAHTGCSSGSDSAEAQWEAKTEESKKGVITFLKEDKTGEFKITDETVVPKKEDSKVVITYLDGKIDTLDFNAVSAIAKENKHEKQYSGNNHGMNNILFWGMMGYFMGRRTSSPMQRGVYANQQTYQKSMTSSTSVKPKVTRTKKPANGKSGFFNRNGSKSSRSVGRSFGG